VTWLVTGGAGYVGAHVARALEDRGLPVVVLDDLSSGHAAFVRAGTAFVEGSVTDPATVRAALLDNGCTGVVHLAGFKYAGVSVERPLHTYTQNVTGTQVLLAQMVDLGVQQLVFSSSAAVYGTPDVDVVTEWTSGRP
jgi:UDP-glucose 4-epimerase